MIKLLLIILVLSCSAAAALEFTGKAYRLDTDKLVYLEKHRTKEDPAGFNLLIETEYTYPDGRVFARIKSDFAKDRIIPDVIFEDIRFSTKDELEYNPERKSIRIIHTDLKNKSTENNVFEVQNNMLAGQGFNNFLLQNFDSLAKGESIPVCFIVLASMDYFRFDIKMKPANSPDLIEFGLKVHNLILRLFVSEIRVSYSRSSKRLKTFKGLSNITDDQGEPLKVRIEYEYPK